MLCAVLLGLAGPSAMAEPSGPVNPGSGVGAGAGSGAEAEVARLYRQAATVTRQYEEGRSAARHLRGEKRRLDERLATQRARITALHRDLGSLARAQYRTGGQLPQVARLLLAHDADDLLQGERAVQRTRRYVTHAVTETRRAERTLADDERKTASARHRLDRRTTRLAKLKKTLDGKLAVARRQLQDEAEDAVAVEQCPPVVRLPREAPLPAGTWVLPVDGYQLSAGFDSEGEHWEHRHTGQDFAVPLGTPVRAVGAGRVVSVACGGPFGIQIVLQHPNGFCTQYAHLSAVALRPGEEVAAGQVIGQSGSTGNSTGPHLHFEVRQTPEYGSAVDPVAWLAGKGLTV
ncbi:M23 family metallopeptidase [Streptomyces odontomachi]|uniref:M23 family metallopeptidase n=1 Tax=Streptomyces odontomachi TaxID=2944940 RepID=UPI00210D8CE0|nr:M23 family metallopeptidase [Streptomyces sp. ODS25]